MMLAFATVLLLLLPCISFAQRTFDVTIADSTYHMKRYWLACR